VLSKKAYTVALDSEMDTWVDLMKKCWGEAPELEPKVEVVLKVSMDFDLGDFPHQGQTFYVSEDKFKKLSPDKVAKKIVQEINSHRNRCDRCGVPTPHIWLRQHGVGGRWVGKNNWRTGKPWTEEDIAMYDLPPDELERKLHPQLSRWLDRRLIQKAEREKEEAEKKVNPIDWVYNIKESN